MTGYGNESRGDLRPTSRRSLIAGNFRESGRSNDRNAVVPSRYSLGKLQRTLDRPEARLGTLLISRRSKGRELEGLSIAERDDWCACHSATLLSYSGLERSEALCRALLHFCFESPINANQFFPKGCEGRAAASAPASGSKSHGFDEAVVQAIQ